MKKIISIVVFSLLCSNLGFASVEEVLKEIKKNKDIAQGFNKVIDRGEDNKSNNKEDDNVELSEKEERLARDYQLRRALDLIRGLSIFEESLEE